MVGPTRKSGSSKGLVSAQRACWSRSGNDAFGRGIGFGGVGFREWDPRQLVFLAKDHHAGETYLDLGAPGPSNGDRVEFADRLFDTRGNEVGRNVADCVHVIVGPPPASATELGSCQITLLLKEGKVVLAGAYGSDEMIAGALSFAVVGGTGRYRGAKGEAVSQFLPDHSARITVRFE